MERITTPTKGQQAMQSAKKAPTNAKKAIKVGFMKKINDKKSPRPAQKSVNSVKSRASSREDAKSVANASSIHLVAPGQKATKNSRKRSTSSPKNTKKRTASSKNFGVNSLNH